MELLQTSSKPISLFQYKVHYMREKSRLPNSTKAHCSRSMYMSSMILWREENDLENQTLAAHLLVEPTRRICLGERGVWTRCKPLGVTPISCLRCSWVIDPGPAHPQRTGSWPTTHPRGIQLVETGSIPLHRRGVHPIGWFSQWRGHQTIGGWSGPCLGVRWVVVRRKRASLRRVRILPSIETNLRSNVEVSPVPLVFFGDGGRSITIWPPSKMPFGRLLQDPIPKQHITGKHSVSRFWRTGYSERFSSSFILLVLTHFSPRLFALLVLHYLYSGWGLKLLESLSIVG